MITEAEFIERLCETLSDPDYKIAVSVTGPGRSGSMAAIYASHLLGIEYVPYGRLPNTDGPIILIDIAGPTVRPLERLGRRYKDYTQILCLLFETESAAPLWFELSPDQLKYVPNVRVYDQSSQEAIA